MNRKLNIYHANAKGTGSALGIELLPAVGSCDGQVILTLANQKAISDGKNGEPTFPQFDHLNGICLCLDPLEVEKIIEVVEGSVESINDGKGIFNVSAGVLSTFKFSHVIDPVCGYRLEIEKSFNGETFKVGIFLSSSEGNMLAQGFKASMGLLLFGENK